MNMRKKERMVEILADYIKKLDVGKTSMLVVSFPDGVDSKLMEVLQSSISGAMKLLGVDNPVLLLPDSVSINELSEGQMNRLGWRRDHSLLQGFTDMRKVIERPPVKLKPFNELKEIWNGDTEERTVPAAGQTQNSRSVSSRFSCG